MITAGFDIGTRFVKVCVVDGQSVLGYAVEEAGKDMRKIIRNAYKKALERSGVKKRAVERRMSTGYGSALVKKADAAVPEAPCLARAMHALNPGVRLAVDVGGLFINVIGVNPKGFVDGALTNDKCAAGSGKFLEMVSETLSVPFKSISDLALRSNSPYAINSQCAVFAESEIISQVNGGRDGGDILAGVIKSIVTRAVTLIERSDSSGQVALCGGISRLPAFRVMFERMIKSDAYLPHMDPQIIAAYGAALLAEGRAALRKNGSDSTAGPGPSRVMESR